MREANSFGGIDLQLIENIIEPGDTCVDIGANIGCYSLFFSSLVGPQGKVFSFEPDPGNAETFKINVQLNKARNIYLHQVGLGAFNETASLYRSSANIGDHRFGVSESEKIAREKVTVEIRTYDDYFFNSEITPNFVKMDCQGFEPHILEGMKNCLKNAPPIIMTEYCPHLIHRSASSPFEIFSFIDKNRFYPFFINFENSNGQNLLPATYEHLLAFTSQLMKNQEFTDLLLVPQSKMEWLQTKVRWSARQDLNLRPPAPEAGALPG